MTNSMALPVKRIQTVQAMTPSIETPRIDANIIVIFWLCIFSPLRLGKPGDRPGAVRQSFSQALIDTQL